MVEVRNVTKQYGGVRVVDDVSLNIAKGKITSFIGPNGAGKSTLLSMITRLISKEGRLTPEDQQWIQEAIDYMELAPFRKKYLDELSGGQRQRAYIAMVIAQNTEYILLDEPLNNLDMKHSVQIMKVLRRMVDELGKTIVIVIHDINFASCYSDYIVALKDGRVVKEGKTEDIIDTDVLQSVYDMHIPVQWIDGRKICVYFA